MASFVPLVLLHEVREVAREALLRRGLVRRVEAFIRHHPPEVLHNLPPPGLLYLMYQSNLHVEHPIPQGRHPLSSLRLLRVVGVDGEDGGRLVSRAIYLTHGTAECLEGHPELSGDGRGDGRGGGADDRRGEGRDEGGVAGARRSLERERNK